MSERDPLARGRAMEVSPWVRNAVVVALWVPPILLLWSVAIAAVGMAYRLALYGDLPNTTGMLSGLPFTDTVVLGVAAVLGYTYLILSNVTFGTEAVEAGMEQAEQLRDEVEEGDGE